MDSKLNPKAYASGIFDDGSERYSYICMEKLGPSLQDYLMSRKNAFSLKTVCQIGIKIIQCLEELHHTGFVHNDLKPDNVLFDDKMLQLKLIDFGLCTKYLDDSG